MRQKTSKPTKTNWERAKREAAQDAPIAHTAADGPYDPNDAAAAVASYWQQASISEAVAHGLTKA